MHSKSDKEITTNDKADKFIQKLFKSLLNRYKNNLAKSMKGSEFVFDYVYQQKFDEKLKEQFFNTYNSLAMITTSHYLKKKIFTFT